MVVVWRMTIVSLTNAIVPRRLVVLSTPMVPESFYHGMCPIEAPAARGAGADAGFQTGNTVLPSKTVDPAFVGMVQLDSPSTAQDTRITDAFDDGTWQLSRSERRRRDKYWRIHRDLVNSERGRLRFLRRSNHQASWSRHDVVSLTVARVDSGGAVHAHDSPPLCSNATDFDCMITLNELVWDKLIL